MRIRQGVTFQIMIDGSGADPFDGLISQTTTQSTRKCYNCGQPGHKKVECPEPPKGGANYKNPSQEQINPVRGPMDYAPPPPPPHQCPKGGPISRKYKGKEKCDKESCNTGNYCRICWDIKHKQCFNHTEHECLHQQCKKCKQFGHGIADCPLHVCLIKEKELRNLNAYSDQEVQSHVNPPKSQDKKLRLEDRREVEEPPRKKARTVTEKYVMVQGATKA